MGRLYQREGELFLMNVLSESLRLYCAVRKISTRNLAKVWGCSPITVSRFLNGKPVEMRTFVKILDWATEEMLFKEEVTK